MFNKIMMKLKICHMKMMKRILKTIIKIVDKLQIFKINN